jgi:hypothetical protein
MLTNSQANLVRVGENLVRICATARSFYSSRLFGSKTTVREI